MFQQLRNYFLFILSLMFLFLSRTEGKQWALLISGSKGWINYRHQADLCHAYQMLRSQGIPKENIITMFYDDIANNTSNPDKGVIINQPNGPNVYEGVIKDYTKDDLSVKNFLNVLKGDKQAMAGIGSGKVIESGPEDTIFINIIDHGYAGSITINDEYLYADELNDALKYMKTNNRYSKMLIYVESCESGSMFDSIIGDNSSIFVMTAAAPGESSFVRYYSDKLNIYIGDAFSTIWMEKMDALREVSNPCLTLFKHYKYVRTNVNSSHVMLYGDFSLGFDSIFMYMANRTTGLHKNQGKSLACFSETPTKNRPENEEQWVPSHEIQVEMINELLKKSKNIMKRTVLKRQLRQIEEDRSKVDGVIDSILLKLVGTDYGLFWDLTKTKKVPSLEVFPCYRQLVSEFNKHCMKTHENTYATRHFYKFFNICTSKLNISTISEVMTFSCQVLRKTDIQILI